MKRANLFCALLLLGFLAGGCAMPPDQGRMVRTGEVDQLIEFGSNLPGYTYYYAGPETYPDAIIAIENSFTLQSKYWIRVDEGVDDKLREWNRLLENDTRIKNRYEGYWIMTPDGRQAGMWYSRFNYRDLRFPDSTTIILYAPLPLLLEKKTPSFWFH